MSIYIHICVPAGAKQDAARREHLQSQSQLSVSYLRCHYKCRHLVSLVRRAASWDPELPRTTGPV